jgi:hypothetical protein
LAPARQAPSRFNKSAVFLSDFLNLYSHAVGVIIVSILLTISLRLRLALLELRAKGVRQYVLARRVGLHPSLLSHIINGSIPLHENDPRVLRIAAAVGVPADQAFAAQDDDLAVGGGVPVAHSENVA